MKLSKFSIHKLQKTFNAWQVYDDYSLPVTNYLVHGLEPGSFFTSVLANDFAGAMTYSHLEFENAKDLMFVLHGMLDDSMADEANRAFDWAIKILESYDSSLG